MGREIAHAAFADMEIALSGALEVVGHPAIDKDISEFFGPEHSGVPIHASVDSLDLEQSVIIDFTLPEGTESLLNTIADKRTSVVIGTTGLTDNQIGQIEQVAKNAAILFSPNMSLGVNFLFYLTKIAAEKLGTDFDIEIVEAHHRFKKDAPSGTAKKLGEIAAEALEQSYNESMRHGREGIVGERTPKEIGMHALRGGDIVGEHTVLFAGLGERVELKHCAHSRATFAQGAIRAAKWLATQKPGLYSMQDLLGF